MDTPLTEQPIPDVSSEDVDRILERDYPQEAQEVLRNLIANFDVRDKERVALASLKIADGDLPRAEKALADAIEDSRDVIVAAEYPNYYRNVLRINDLPAEKLEKIYKEDWEQYSSWLYADRPPRQDT